MKLKNNQLKQNHSNLKTDVYLQDHIIHKLIDSNQQKLENSNLFLSQSIIESQLFQRTFKKDNQYQSNDEYFLDQMLAIETDIIFAKKYQFFVKDSKQCQNNQKINKNQNSQKLKQQNKYLSKQITQQIAFLIGSEQKALSFINNQNQNLTKSIVFYYKNHQSSVNIKEFQFRFNKLRDQLIDFASQKQSKSNNFNFTFQNIIQIIKQKNISVLELAAFFRTNLSDLRTNQSNHRNSYSNFNNSTFVSSSNSAIIKTNTLNLLYKLQQIVVSSFQNRFFNIKLITRIAECLVFQIQLLNTCWPINFINILVIFQRNSVSNYSDSNYTDSNYNDSNYTGSNSSQDYTIGSSQINQFCLSYFFISQIQYVVLEQILKTMFHLQQYIPNKQPKMTHSSGRVLINVSDQAKVTITSSIQLNFDLTFQTIVQLFYKLHKQYQITFQLLQFQKVLKEFKNCHKYNIKSFVQQSIQRNMESVMQKRLIFNCSDEDYAKNIILLIEHLQTQNFQQLSLFDKKTLLFFNTNQIKQEYQHQKISQKFDQYCFGSFIQQNFVYQNQIHNYSQTIKQNQNLKQSTTLTFVNNLKNEQTQNLLNNQKNTQIQNFADKSIQKQMVKFDEFIDLFALQQTNWINQQSYQEQNDYEYL